MIKILEKDFLNDDFINKELADNIKIKEKISFTKENIYYFGNYELDKLKIIKKKMIKNKKSLIKAIEKGIKFIICGNSIEIFNNDFKTNGLNIYTNYNPSIFKRRGNNLKIKNDKGNASIKTVNSINKVIASSNFRYKNLICIANEEKIDKIIKKSR